MSEPPPPRGPETFTLELPASAAYVTTGRLFAGAVAKHFDCEDAVVEDLKLAMSEACAQVLANPESGRLVVTIGRRGRDLTFEVSGIPGPRADDSRVQPHPIPLGLELLTALFPDVEVTSGDTVARVTFTVGAP